MNHFELREGALWCEDTPLDEIVRAVGTPVYVYSSATLQRHYRVFIEALNAHEALRGALVAFAVKSNSSLSVLATLTRLGAGADTVSEGEIRRALAAGTPAERIVFSGVGKTGREIAFALEAGVGQINVESEPELGTVAAIAREGGRLAPVAIRVNPDIAAGGHAKISTGAAQSKFGVSRSEAERLYAAAAANTSLIVRGVACHIGSQITDLSPMASAFAVMRELVLDLRRQGLPVERLDLGGGLGVPYFNQPDPPGPDAFAAVAAKAVEGLDVQAVFEPGRFIAANAGVLLASVIHVHERPEGRRFLVLDAAMNDLIRPAMYDAWHDIRPVRPRGGPLRDYDVVGPVCETGDTFARARPLPALEGGDLVAFMSAGAYGAVMASEYNSRPLAPEVLVRGAEWALVRRRPTYEEMLAREPTAPWLS
ncbi:MAG TPA: diaminopimelate decarboxylase [Caulobacteraceae bacterium]|jgi:diaminopimelate decarboxylase|nr:diaminopimelate decarboxylase [Caulobacteraceae bacterium]